MKKLHLPLLICMMIACEFRPDELNSKEYLKWRFENSNDFVQSREHQHFTVMAEYMEPQFLALLEQENSQSSHDFQTLYNEYKCGITYNISFKVKDPKFNLLQKDISSIEAYNQRIYILSYKMDELIYLEINGERIKPVLYNYEGYNELNNKINFRTVFVPEKLNCDQLSTVNSMVLTVDDQIWGSGITTFIFEDDAIGDFPEVVK